VKGYKDSKLCSKFQTSASLFLLGKKKQKKTAERNSVVKAQAKNVIFNQQEPAFQRESCQNANQASHKANSSTTRQNEHQIGITTFDFLPPCAFFFVRAITRKLSKFSGTRREYKQHVPRTIAQTPTPKPPNPRALNPNPNHAVLTQQP
jgi:hypothetical protein